MEYITNFFNYLIKIFAKIPIYLRGLVLFIIIVLISNLVNKYYSSSYSTRSIKYKSTYEEPGMQYKNNNDVITIDEKNNNVRGESNNNYLSNSPMPRIREKKEANFDKLLTPQKNDYYFGQENALITIVEYSSFRCPYCIKFHEDNMENVKNDYIDTGKVRYIKRIIIQKDTLLGVMLSYCAKAENKYTLLNDLYRNTDKWVSSSNQKRELKEIALRNGFTDNTFDSCIRNSKLANELLEKQKNETGALKLYSTPTMFINGERESGAMPYKSFSKKINTELEKIKK